MTSNRSSKGELVRFLSIPASVFSSAENGLLIANMLAHLRKIRSYPYWTLDDPVFLEFNKHGEALDGERLDRSQEILFKPRLGVIVVTDLFMSEYEGFLSGDWTDIYSLCALELEAYTIEQAWAMQDDIFVLRCIDSAVINVFSKEEWLLEKLAGMLNVEYKWSFESESRLFYL